MMIKKTVKAKTSESAGVIAAKIHLASNAQLKQIAVSSARELVRLRILNKDTTK